MTAIRMTLRKLRACEGGATAIEYGLIVALIAIALITGLQSLSDQNTGLWGSTSTKVNDAIAGPPDPAPEAPDA